MTYKNKHFVFRKKIIYLFVLTVFELFNSHSIMAEEWIADDSGCRALNYRPQHLETIEWTGACVDGYISGQGVLNWFWDGIQRYSYEGNYVQGKLQGKGVLKYLNGKSDGIKVEAEFVDGHPNGFGVETWPDGARYEGEFKKGVKTKGVKTWPNGARYEGEFKDGKPMGEGFKEAEVISSVTPEYPKELLRYGNGGTVLLRAILESNAEIKGIDVLESNHPAFEKAAVKAFLQSKISPNIVQGKAVPSSVKQHYVFNVDAEVVLPYTYPAQANEKLPELFQYDKPPKDKYVAPLVYPYDLLKNKIKGSATVSVVIDPRGQPRQVKVIDASKPALGASLKAMVESSSFYAARKNKQASWSAFSFKREFSENNRDTYIDEHAKRILAELKKERPDIVKLEQLDFIPEALYKPSPAYPPELADKGVTGTVNVEFYIDREGGVQLPQVVKATSEELGWLALAAVSRWQFQPPKLKGQAVDVIATIPISFNVKK